MLGHSTDTFLFSFLSHRSMMETGLALTKVLATITPLLSNHLTTRMPTLSTTACCPSKAPLFFSYISRSALKLHPRRRFSCTVPSAGIPLKSNKKRKTSCQMLTFSWITCASFSTMLPLVPLSGWPGAGSISPVNMSNECTRPLDCKAQKVCIPICRGFWGMYCFRADLPLNGTICSSTHNIWCGGRA